jgi:class 3 adenylate cyclase
MIRPSTDEDDDKVHQIHAQTQTRHNAGTMEAKTNAINSIDDEKTHGINQAISKNNESQKVLSWELSNPTMNDQLPLLVNKPQSISIHRTSLFHNGEEEEEDIDDNDDDSYITSTSLSQSGRSASVTERLQQQGFVQRHVRDTKTSTNFAMKSIRRGSTEWNQTLRPFVANIVFESFVQRRYYQSEGSCSIQRFRPYKCYAAVLFVDMCNYSKITAIIAHRGAHVLSNIVNEYLRRILCIVKQYGGDVITFAGDAIIVVWYSSLDDDLRMNVLTAATCVLDMQQKAGNHPVDGLSCGILESEIFAAHNHINMQRLFHTVGGNSLMEQSDLVDMAKPGEVCISDDVAKHLSVNGKYIERTDEFGVQFKILSDIDYDKNTKKAIKVHIVKSKNRQEQKRIKSFEEEFIHPNVVKLLCHGGLSPTQISQMRNLCVLFIAMTSNFGSTVNWLMEVQTILDKHRCPSTYFLPSNILYRQPTFIGLPNI